MSGSISRRSRRSSSSEAEALSRVVQRLRQQFPEVPPDALEEIVNGHYEAFDGRPIRDFVAVLVERATRADLEAGIGTPALAGQETDLPDGERSSDEVRFPPHPSQIRPGVAAGASVR